MKPWRSGRCSAWPVTDALSARDADSRAPITGNPAPGCPPWLRLSAGLLLGVMAALTSPVVGAFLALTLVAWGVAEMGGSNVRLSAC